MVNKMDNEITKEEAIKMFKRYSCSNCGVYLGGGGCNPDCIIIKAFKAIEQKPYISEDENLFKTLFK